MTKIVRDLRLGKPNEGHLAATSCAALLTGVPVPLNKDTKVRYLRTKFENAAVYLVVDGDPLKGQEVVIPDHVKLR